MNKPCQHAAYCPRRLRDGDRPDGCSSTDAKTCTPTLDKPKPIQLHDRIAERYLFTMFQNGAPGK